MPIRIYEYKNCSTCQKAIRFLDSKKLGYEKIPIVENPPSMAELKRMLQFLKEDGGSIKNLFNTSGQVYREMKISDKLKAGLTENEALELLSKNGKLIKRPFLLTSKGGTVGFKPEAWEPLLGKSSK